MAFMSDNVNARRKPSFGAYKEDKLLSTLSPALNILILAAKKAGRKIVRDFGEIENLQSSGSPASFANKALEKSKQTLIEYLSSARPNYSYVFADGMKIEGSDTSNTFLIAPLDGFINFTHGIPTFAVSIAIVRDGTVLAGVIYNPITDELFYAEQGGGAFLMTGSGDKRLRVSSRRNLNEALIAVDFTLSDTIGIEAYQKKMLDVIKNALGVRRIGCPSLAMAYTAMGKFDGHWCKLSHAAETAAGYIIVKEAGGHVRSTSGNAKAPDLLYEGSVISTNDGLDANLSRAFKD